MTDSESRSLFEVARADPGAGAAVLTRLRTYENRWTQDAPRRRVSVREIRARRASDELLGTPFVQDLNLAEFESRELVVAEAIQHADLHGMNVMVDRNGNPVLIDYGAAGEGIVSLDPIILELSFLFHPAGRAISDGWPDVAQAREWAHIDRYSAASPYADLIRASRSWAEANGAGQRAMLANAYAQALRQFAYSDVDPRIAKAVIEAVIAAW